MTMTKQEIQERCEDLDMVVAKAMSDASELARRSGLAAQKTDRLQLESECAASGGHFFRWPGDHLCFFCGYDKNTPANTTAANLSKG